MTTSKRRSISDVVPAKGTAIPSRPGGETRAKISYKVTPERHTKLKIAAIERHFTLQDLIDEAVSDWIKKHERSKT